MAEEQSQSEVPDTSTQQQGGEEKTQTLDDVYKTFNVEAEAQSFHPQREQAQTQQQPQQQQQPKQEVAVPDPVLDPAGYKAWAGNQSQFVQQALSQIQGQLSQFQVERLRSKEEADIKSAVQQFRSVTGDDVDDDIAEVALGQKARKDPKFLAVYQNRAKNPNAWRAAVSAYANEFKSKSTFKIDPQIAENQRAAKQSIQGSQTKQKDDESTNPIERRLVNKTGRDFEREWRNIVDSN